MIKLDMAVTEHDDGYRVRDWFNGGMATIAAAEAASTVEEADAILRAAYRGPDIEGVGVCWVIVQA